MIIQQNDVPGRAEKKYCSRGTDDIIKLIPQIIYLFRYPPMFKLVARLAEKGISLRDSESYYVQLGPKMVLLTGSNYLV